ncbi:SDR family oxidoreductase [uncultured Williamsia sp.]|uniref:SDR family oxidoreductase n=1 Tax=uncultured Williamsia sp. TaxID=259311 RepID=UPI00261CC070|nr:SDR family oxidoreductase [uncultured Williamsia sp.]
MTAADRTVRDLEGVRILVVGASSGIGQACATAAARRGARTAIAARRTDLLDEIASRTGGIARALDVSDADEVRRVVGDVASAMGGLDAVIVTSAVAPFARVDETDATTWLHAFSVNSIGVSNVMESALAHLDADATMLIASAHDVGRPRAGVAAYNASKAALNEMLRSWRAERPELSLIRVDVGPTKDTEILRGADREMLAELWDGWMHSGQVPAQMSALEDVANTIVSLLAMARANPSVVPEVVALAPRYR